MGEKNKRAIRVIVADDDRDTVVTLAFILENEGFEVHRAYGGRDAIAAVDTFDPDALIVDLAMPDPSGWEVARSVHAMQKGARPLLIAVSGQYVKAADRTLTEIAGFDHFCRKPCAPTELIAWLSNLKPRA